MAHLFFSPHSRLRMFTVITIVVLVFSLVSPVSVQPTYALAAPIPISPADGTETTINNYPPLAIPTVAAAGRWSNPVRVQFDTISVCYPDCRGGDHRKHPIHAKCHDIIVDGVCTGGCRKPSPSENTAAHDLQ
jgi:hypothetical protein